LVATFGGVWLAGMLPPLSPSSSAIEIQQFFLDNSIKIRIGVLVAMLGAALMGPFIATISTQMKRIEGAESPLSYTQLLAGLISTMLGVIPLAFLAIAAFREGRPAELILLMYDASWLMNIGIIFPTMLQLSVVGVCAFLDKDEVVFPRWYAWLSIWASFVFLVDLLVFFMKTGPFAFNGLISFWLALAVLGSWLVVTFFVLRKAVLTREYQQPNKEADRLRPAVASTL